MLDRLRHSGEHGPHPGRQRPDPFDAGGTRHAGRTGHFRRPDFAGARMTPRPGGQADDRSRQRTVGPTAEDATAQQLAKRLIDNLHHQQAKLPRHATRNDWYMALAYTIRERVLDGYIATLDAITGANLTAKVVAYLSAEFLVGPHLGNSLVNLGLRQVAEEAVASVGADLSALLEQEEEPGLGNGGLGRLAACYMDSLATLNIPAI